MSYSEPQRPLPKFFKVMTAISEPLTPPTVLCGSANFYRTVANSNIELIIPTGPNLSGVYTSPNTYLPMFTFNATENNTALDFINDVDAKALRTVLYIHDVMIQYKITQDNSSNFVNNRELQLTLVKEDGTTVYDNAITTNTHPESGISDTIILKGCISHYLNDVVKIKMNIIQDNTATASKLTITRISWNILCSINSLQVSYSNAAFYRTPSNTDLKLTIPLGTDLLMTNIFTSFNTFLLTNSFNSTRQNDAVIFPSNNYAQILQSYTYSYDICIYFKLSLVNETNYVNSRELITTIVGSNGTLPYDAAIVSSNMPGSGQYDYVLLKGCIFHNVNDIARLRFQIIQDSNLSGQSDTLLTINHISWNMSIEYAVIPNNANVQDIDNVISFKQVIDPDTIYYLLTVDYAVEIISDTYHTVQLPGAVGNSGRMYIICRGSNNNALVIKAAVGEFIDSSNQINLKRKNYHLEIICNGIDSWYIL